MERLTERTHGSIAEELVEEMENPIDAVWVKNTGNKTCEGICNEQESCDNCPLYEVMRKLADYEDAEEQGLLLRLPCKVGDTVYFTDRKYDRENRTFIPFVHNGYVKAIKFSARPTKITIEYEDLDDRHGRCKGHDIHASNIGKTVFLTREEAEKALEEMKGGAK